MHACMMDHTVNKSIVSRCSIKELNTFLSYNIFLKPLEKLHQEKVVGRESSHLVNDQEENKPLFSMDHPRKDGELL